MPSASPVVIRAVHGLARCYRHQMRFPRQPDHYGVLLGLITELYRHLPSTKRARWVLRYMTWTTPTESIDELSCIVQTETQYVYTVDPYTRMWDSKFTRGRQKFYCEYLLTKREGWIRTRRFTQMTPGVYVGARPTRDLYLIRHNLYY